MRALLFLNRIKLLTDWFCKFLFLAVCICSNGIMEIKPVRFYQLLKSHKSLENYCGCSYIFSDALLHPALGQKHNKSLSGQYILPVFSNPIIKLFIDYLQNSFPSFYQGSVKIIAVRYKTTLNAFMQHCFGEVK